MNNFVITAATISGNKGAESMFSALYQNLKKKCPDSHFYLMSYYPEIDKQFNKKDVTIVSGTPLRLLFLTLLSIIYLLLGKLNVIKKIFEFDKSFKTISMADLFFDIGGITFSDGREIYLPFNIVTILPAIIMDKKVIKCSQAMGPFKNCINKVFAKMMLTKVDLVYARGKNTSENLKSINLKKNKTASDLAFKLEFSGKEREIVSRYIPTGKKILGISPSSVIYKNSLKNNIDYIKILIEFCEMVKNNYDYNLLFIPHSLRLNTDKLKNNDLPIIREVVANLNKDRVFIVEDDLYAIEFRSIIQSCDYFIASRFHSMVSSLKVGVPTLVCGWGHKYFEVLDDFELKDCAFDYKKLTSESLFDKFVQLQKNEISIREKISKNICKVERSAEVQINESLALIRNK